MFTIVVAIDLSKFWNIPFSALLHQCQSIFFTKFWCKSGPNPMWSLMTFFVKYQITDWFCPFCWEQKRIDAIKKVFYSITRNAIILYFHFVRDLNEIPQQTEMKKIVSFRSFMSIVPLFASDYENIICVMLSPECFLIM
jgi:hypothetical protein